MSKVYDKIAERISEALKNGTCPWRKTWKGATAPCNISGRKYSGANFFILSLAGYTNPVFMTFNQIRKSGGNVIKGQKGWPVIFWKFLETKDKVTGDKVTFPMLRYFTVFNIEQTEGVKLPKKLEIVERTDVEVVDAAQAIIDGYVEGPTVETTGSRAFYTPKKDQVTMPKQASFESDNSYYSVMFHELGHSTGHSTRLNREKGMTEICFGSHEYSKEELVAELTAAFLCGVSGIDNTLDNSAAYIANWMKSLTDNPKWFIQAAGKAQKAANFIQGIKPEAAS